MLYIKILICGAICLFFSKIINSSALALTTSPPENELPMPSRISETRIKIEKLIKSNEKPYALKWFGDRWILHCFDSISRKLKTYELNAAVDKILNSSITKTPVGPTGVYPKNIPWKLAADLERYSIPDLYEIVYDANIEGDEYWSFVGKECRMSFTVSSDGKIRRLSVHYYRQENRENSVRPIL